MKARGKTVPLKVLLALLALLAVDAGGTLLNPSLKTPNPQPEARSWACAGPMTTDQCAAYSAQHPCTCKPPFSQDDARLTPDITCCCPDRPDDVGERSCRTDPYVNNGTQCMRGCCDPPAFMPCAMACCPVDSKTCGFRLNQNSTMHGGDAARKECCADRSLSLENQTKDGCCIWGSGLDCRDPTRQTRCCMGCLPKFQVIPKPANLLWYCDQRQFDPCYYCQESCDAWEPAPSCTADPLRWLGPVLGIGISLLVVGGAGLGVCYHWKAKHAPAGSGAPPPQKWAIVIANSHYGPPGHYHKMRSLPKADQDGTDMESFFQSIGYAVLIVKNGDKKEMEDVFSTLRMHLASSATRQPVLPIYIAAHGLEVQGNLFLCPANMTAHKPEAELHLNQILLGLRSVGTSRPEGLNVELDILLLLDLCREDLSSKSELQAEYGKIIQSFTDLRREARQDGISGLRFSKVYACEGGFTALEERGPQGKNSFFVKAIKNVMKRLGRNGLTWSEFGKRVSAEVLKLSDGRQRPQLEIDLAETPQDVQLVERPRSHCFTECITAIMGRWRHGVAAPAEHPGPVAEEPISPSQRSATGTLLGQQHPTGTSTLSSVQQADGSLLSCSTSSTQNVQEAQPVPAEVARGSGEKELLKDNLNAPLLLGP